MEIQKISEIIKLKLDLQKDDCEFYFEKYVKQDGYKIIKEIYNEEKSVLEVILEKKFDGGI